MELTHPQSVLRTDFNSLSHGTVTASRRFAIAIWGPLDRGTRVTLEDAEGNGCEGVVVSSDRVVRVRPVWRTWHAGSPRSWEYLAPGRTATLVHQPGGKLRTSPLSA
jgi:hypothetical protein